LVLLLQNKQDRQTNKPTVSWQTPSSSLLQDLLCLHTIHSCSWLEFLEAQFLSLSLSLSLSL
jgi:hypothetical protein